MRFDISKYMQDSKDSFKEYFSIYVYIKAYNDLLEHTSAARTTNKKDFIHPILIDGYTHEVKFALTPSRKYPLQFSKAVKDGLWEMQWDHRVRYAHKDIFEVAIPFDDIGIKSGESFDFFFITGCSGVTEDIFPKDIPLSMTRP